MTTLLNCVIISTLFSIYVFTPIIAATFLIFFCATLIAHPHSYPLRFVLLSHTLVIILSHLRFSFLLLLVSMYTCPISNLQTMLQSVMNCLVRNGMLLFSCCYNEVQLLYDSSIDKVNLSIGHHVPPKPIHSKPAIPYNVWQLLKEKTLLDQQGCLQKSF